MRGSFDKRITHAAPRLVGGWTNPFEKYARQNGWFLQESGISSSQKVRTVIFLGSREKISSSLKPTDRSKDSTPLNLEVPWRSNLSPGELWSIVWRPGTMFEGLTEYDGILNQNFPKGHDQISPGIPWNIKHNGQLPNEFLCANCRCLLADYLPESELLMRNSALMWCEGMVGLGIGVSNSPFISGPMQSAYTIPNSNLVPWVSPQSGKNDCDFENVTWKVYSIYPYCWWKKSG